MNHELAFNKFIYNYQEVYEGPRANYYNISI